MPPASSGVTAGLPCGQQLAEDGPPQSGGEWRYRHSAVFGRRKTPHGGSDVAAELQTRSSL